MSWVYGRRACLAVDREICAALGQTPYQIDFYTENFDSSLFPDEKSQRETIPYVEFGNVHSLLINRLPPSTACMAGNNSLPARDLTI